MDMRTPLSRARGLGSTKDGVGHWVALRLSAMALVPLILWFAYSAVSLVGAGHAAFTAWAGEFGNTLLLVLLTLSMFHHGMLGLQEVIEDYVHTEAIKVAGLIAVKFAAALCATATIVAILRIGLGT